MTHRQGELPRRTGISPRLTRWAGGSAGVRRPRDHPAVVVVRSADLGVVLGHRSDAGAVHAVGRVGAGRVLGVWSLELTLIGCLVRLVGLGLGGLAVFGDLPCVADAPGVVAEPDGAPSATVTNLVGLPVRAAAARTTPRTTPTATRVATRAPRVVLSNSRASTRTPSDRYPVNQSPHRSLGPARYATTVTVPRPGRDTMPSCSNLRPPTRCGSNAWWRPNRSSSTTWSVT